MLFLWKESSGRVTSWASLCLDFIFHKKNIYYCINFSSASAHYTLVIHWEVMQLTFWCVFLQTYSPHKYINISFYSRVINHFSFTRTELFLDMWVWHCDLRFEIYIWSLTSSWQRAAKTFGIFCHKSDKVSFVTLTRRLMESP